MTLTGHVERKPNGVAKPWFGQLLVLRTDSGYCSSCKTRISHAALSDRATIYAVHKDHIRRVTANAIVLGPQEYGGLNLQVPFDLLTSVGVSILPCIIIRLSCHQCVSETLPSSADEVYAFRTAHSHHIYDASLEVVVQNTFGKVITSEFPVRGQQREGQSKLVRQSLEAGERVKELESLCHTLRCKPYGLDCRLCNSQHYFESISEAKVVLAHHECHIRTVSMNVYVTEPQEFGGIRLRLPAELVSSDSIAESVRVDCIMLELVSMESNHVLTPWGRPEIDRYLEVMQHRSVKLRVLLRNSDRGVIKRLVALGVRPAGAAWPNRGLPSDEQTVRRAMKRGVVKCFSKRGGYGFIQCSTGEEVFCHFSAIQMAGFKSLREGEEVEFEIVQKPKGLEAAQVFKVEGPAARQHGSELP